MTAPINPFLIAGYQSPYYFCDREEETQLLTDYIKNRNSLTLFAFRRLGKTGLIKHCFYKLRKEKNLICIYVDIYDTLNKADFINKLATAIYNAFPAKHSVGKKIIAAIKLFRPVISFDEFSGLPSVAITATLPEQQTNTIAGLFSFLDNQNIQIVFAIDEFQQILTYPEKNMEAILRTQMQELQHTSFVFCGSNQTQMHEIFTSTKRPFFGSCTYINLAEIKETKYKPFIVKMFKKYTKTIEPNAIDFICNWTKCHTFYTQYLCNQLFVKSGNNITVLDVKQVAASILKLQEGKFYQYRNLLTASQWKILTAIAKEERLTQPNSKAFIATHHLGTPSSVSRGVESLVKKEMILHHAGVEIPYYEVYDKYLMRWLQGK